MFLDFVIQMQDISDAVLFLHPNLVAGKRGDHPADGYRINL
jgi:hypothetical protein